MFRRSLPRRCLSTAQLEHGPVKKVLDLGEAGPKRSDGIVFRGTEASDYEKYKAVVERGCSIAAPSLDLKEKAGVASMALSSVGPLRNQLLTMDMTQNTQEWAMQSFKGRVREDPDSSWGWGTGWISQTDSQVQTLFSAAHCFSEKDQERWHTSSSGALFIRPESGKHLQVVELSPLFSQRQHIVDRSKSDHKDWARFGPIPPCISIGSEILKGIPLCDPAFHRKIAVGDKVFLVGRVFSQDADYSIGMPWERLVGPVGSLSIQEGEVLAVDVSKGTITHSCSALPGFCGGPLLMRDGTGSMVAVAVHSGMDSSKKSTAAQEALGVPHFAVANSAGLVSAGSDVVQDVTPTIDSLPLE